MNLPSSVENLINQIREQQSQPPLDSSIRRNLAELGEQKALQILYYISTQPIKRSLNAFTVYMINQHRSPPSPSRPSSSQSQSQSQSQSRPYSLQSQLLSHLQSRPSPLPLRSQSLPSSSTAPPPHSDVLTALGELEFRKSFLLMSYAGRENIENVVTAEYVRSLKELTMKNFEKEIWETVGQKYIERPTDRLVYLDWDSGRTHIYQCFVSPNGSLRFKGPILQHTRTHLQKSLGDDNVLLVKFAEDQYARKSETSAQKAAKHYEKFGKEGLRVGLRLYRFFVFKVGGKEEKKKDPTTSSVKCYFVRTESSCSTDERESYILSNRTMFESRSLFMHAHMLPNIDKYMARFSLILSKTYKLNVDWTTVSVKTIPDVCCQDEHGNTVYHNEKRCILTDGTGFISEDLAVLCPNNVLKGSNLKNTHIKEISNLVKLEDMSKAMGEAALSKHQPVDALFFFCQFHISVTSFMCMHL